jgi:hypothetical protein
MSEQPGASHPPRQRAGLAEALAARPGSFWLASLAALAMIIGGVGPWATAFGMASLSGTDMQGWREVAAGALALAMLGVYGARGARLPLLVAAVAGALGAVQAFATTARIDSDGAVTVLGQQYRYLDPAWGVYLVLVGAVVLACCASSLLLRTQLERRAT